MADGTSDYGEFLDRRRFVELAGLTGAGALAGCGGSDTTTEAPGDTATETETETQGSEADTDGEEDTTTTEDETTTEELEVHDVAHVTRTNQAPSDIQYNPQNPAGFSQFSLEVLFEKFARYNFAENGFQAEGMESWEFTGDTFEMTIREGLTWANGDPVTADDVKLQLQLASKMGAPFNDYVSSVETDGDRNVVLQLDGSVNPDIVKYQTLATQWIQTPETVFSEYLENFESMDEEKAATELQDFNWTEPIASGPFAFDSASGSQLVTTRREDHPWSENINYERHNFNFIDGNQATYQAIRNLDVDSALATTPARIVESFPETVKQIKTPGLVGYGLVPNHDKEHVGDRAVRQAIAYLIDRQTVVNNAGPQSKKAPKWEVAINNSNQAEVLGEYAEDFETYGVDESMTDPAAEVLGSADYSKDGGTWKDSNGKAVSIPIQVPSGWTDWIAATETIVDQLNDFGFEAEKDSRSFTNLFSSVWPNGNFKLATGGWNAGAPQGALPYFSLHHVLIQHYRGFQYNYPSANPSRGGTNGDVTVPEIGDFGGADSLTTNPTDRLEELAKTTDSDTAREIVIEQEWVTNVDLPIIPVTEKQEQQWIVDDEWDIPDNLMEAPAAQVWNAFSVLPRKGEMRYDG